MTEGYGADITIAFPKAPQLFASYQPFAQNSTILSTGEQQFTDTEITNVNVTMPYKFGNKFTASTSLTYLNQTIDSNVEGVNTNVTNYTLNQTFTFQPFGINLGLSHSPNQVIGEDDSSDLNTLNLSANFNKGKFNSNLSWQVLQIVDQELKTGYQFSMGYKISENILFDVRAQRNIYEPVNILSLIHI